MSELEKRFREAARQPVSDWGGQPTKIDTPPSIRERHIEMLYDMMIEAGNAVTRDEVTRYYDAMLTELESPHLHSEMRRASKRMITDVDLAGLFACVRFIQSERQ